MADKRNVWIFKSFEFLNSTILQYGHQGALFKYNLTFYNKAAIFLKYNLTL
jgi:CO dehydrogenase/acetyl-CoA synthase gamma subunit (corrinoid Fe-S protein)